MATQTFTDLVTLTQASWFNDVDTATYSYLTTPAGTNTITATGGANLTYATGLLVRWIPAGTNTGATTINITPSGASALGAKNVFSGGAACLGGEIVSGVPAMAVYDGTQFQLVSFSMSQAVGTSASTFTFDGSGGTTGSLTMKYQKVGNCVNLLIPAAQGTSGTGSTVLLANTALPAAIRPVTAQEFPCSIRDNGAAVAPAGMIIVNTSGLIAIYRDGALTTAFTNTTSCGTSAAITLSYYMI